MKKKKNVTLFIMFFINILAGIIVGRGITKASNDFTKRKEIPQEKKEMKQIINNTYLENQDTKITNSKEDKIDKIFNLEESDCIMAETHMEAIPYNTETFFNYSLKMGWGENGWVYAIAESGKTYSDDIVTYVRTKGGNIYCKAVTRIYDESICDENAKLEEVITNIFLIDQQGEITNISEVPQDAHGGLRENLSSPEIVTLYIGGINRLQDTIYGLKGEWKIGKRLEYIDDKEDLSGKSLYMDGNTFQIGNVKQEGVIYTACNYDDYKEDNDKKQLNSFKYLKNLTDTTYGIAVEIERDGQCLGCIYYIGKQVILAINDQLYQLEKENEASDELDLKEEDFTVMTDENRITLNKLYDDLNISETEIPSDNTLMTEQIIDGYFYKYYLNQYENFSITSSNLNYNIYGDDFDTYYIVGIKLKTPLYKTARGCCVGNTREEIEKMYGIGDIEGINSIGMKTTTYRKDGKSIEFTYDEKNKVVQVYLEQKAIQY